MSVTTRTVRCVVTAALAIVTVALLAAPAAAVTDPEQWADTFCTETATWLTSAQQGANTLSTQANDPSLTAAGAKKLLAEYLRTGVGATKAFGQEVKDAGTPDVQNGPKIQAAILTGIAGSQVKLAALEKAAKALPTKPLGVFQKASTKLVNQIGKFADPFTKGVDNAKSLDTSGQLESAISSLPSCAALDQLSSGS